MNWGNFGDALSHARHQPLLRFLKTVVVEPDLILEDNEVRVLAIVSSKVIDLTGCTVTFPSKIQQHQFDQLRRLKSNGHPFFSGFDMYIKADEDAVIVGRGQDNRRYLGLAWAEENNSQLWIPRHTVSGAPIY